MHMRGLRRAFTLIELMVVLSIIIIIVAIAVPVWSTLSGNNSIATAQNQIASMLGNARADALYNRQMTGVFFFLDPTTGQTAMAEVQADLEPQTNPPTPTTGYSYSYTPGNPASTASPLGAAANNNGPVTPLEMANYLPNGAATTANGVQQYVFYRDVLLLPSGVGVALSNNSNPYNANPAPPIDRYLRCGVIMFDATGAITSIPYGVPVLRQTPYVINVNNSFPTNQNQLGKRLGLTSTSGDLVSLTTPSAANGYLYPLVSQAGLLLYDHSAYLNQRTTNSSNPPTPFNDVDLQCDLPANTATGIYLNKVDEETWLDQNGVAFLVSPFNGSLIKAK